ncbi:MAG TPA: AAA family ATPase [Candidatus Saccharimonadales bacterium]|nr:AAA family ATPase [Candidatus Saccharimonadales bacterium]
MSGINLSIIGLSGTNGSGKDSVGHILATLHGYFFISVTELLREEAKRRGLSVERENLRAISAEWRRELGLGVLVDKAIAEYELVKDKHKGLVLASLRNPGEADRVHEFKGTVVWVDADPRVRYDRILANKADRGRLEEDDKSFDEFLAEEQAEMHYEGDNATLNMQGVKDKSDVTLENNYKTLEDFSAYLTQTLNL